MGFANILKQPEFQQNPQLASGVAEVLETRLTSLLENVPVDDQVRYYIGEEHMLDQIQSCSIMVKKYTVRGSNGAIGILGPMRMDYAYNTVALELAADLLHA